MIIITRIWGEQDMISLAACIMKHYSRGISNVRRRHECNQDTCRHRKNVVGVAKESLNACHQMLQCYDYLCRNTSLIALLKVQTILIRSLFRSVLWQPFIFRYPSISRDHRHGTSSDNRRHNRLLTIDDVPCIWQQTIHMTTNDAPCIWQQAIHLTTDAVPCIWQ